LFGKGCRNLVPCEERFQAAFVLAGIPFSGLRSFIGQVMTAAMLLPGCLTAAPVSCEVRFASIALRNVSLEGLEFEIGLGVTIPRPVRVRRVVIRKLDTGGLPISIPNIETPFRVSRQTIITVPVFVDWRRVHSVSPFVQAFRQRGIRIRAEAELQVEVSVIESLFLRRRTVAVSVPVAFMAPFALPVGPDLEAATKAFAHNAYALVR
jgi:hypothetical protein